MTLSGTVSHSQLQTDFDASRAALLANQQGNTRGLRLGTRSVDGLLDTTALSKRAMIWTQGVDQELLVLGLDIYGHSSTTITTTARLENTTAPYQFGDPGDGVRSLVLSQSTSSNTLANVRQDLRTVTGDRHWLLRGHVYRLSVEGDTTASEAVRAWALLGVERRRR